MGQSNLPEHHRSRNHVKTISQSLDGLVLAIQTSKNSWQHASMCPCLLDGRPRALQDCANAVLLQRLDPYS